MAKLSARGRTEVKRLRRVREEEDATRTTDLVLMSDGNILKQSKAKYKDGRSSYNSGYNVFAKLKKGADPKEWGNKRVATGEWFVV